MSPHWRTASRAGCPLPSGYFSAAAAHPPSSCAPRISDRCIDASPIETRFDPGPIGLHDRRTASLHKQEACQNGPHDHIPGCADAGGRRRPWGCFVHMRRAARHSKLSLSLSSQGSTAFGSQAWPGRGTPGSPVRLRRVALRAVMDGRTQLFGLEAVPTVRKHSGLESCADDTEEFEQRGQT